MNCRVKWTTSLKRLDEDFGNNRHRLCQGMFFFFRKSGFFRLFWLRSEAEWERNARVVGVGDEVVRGEWRVESGELIAAALRPCEEARRSKLDKKC